MRSAIATFTGTSKQAYQAAGIDKVALAKSLGVDPEAEKGCFVFLEKALDHPLPEPWTEQVDSKKRVFYWNPVSRHSSWQHPLAGTHKALVAAYRRVHQATDKPAAIEAEIEAFHRQGEEEIGKWRQSQSPDGTPYFYHVDSKITRWDNPRDEVLMHMELRVQLLSELLQDVTQGSSPAGKKSRISPTRAVQQAVKKIQAQARVWQRRRALKIFAEKVLTIQRFWRGAIGRRRFWHVRELRREEKRRTRMPAHMRQKQASDFALIRSDQTAGLSKELLGEGDMVAADAVIPDEIALTLGMDFSNPTDQAAFAIMRELFTRPLPFPWQAIRRSHRRVDYYHPGMREERRQHPLFSYFAEVLAFLRVHARTDVPITEAMTAQIFREASPQILRERLGVWEGPHEDPDLPGGVFFTLIVVGTDPCCADGSIRRDDPRSEASANVAARLAGWQYIWDGFAPAVPFPLLIGRLAALAAQLGEVVVVAPGPAAEDLLELMASRIPKLKPPKPEAPVLTEAEKALQPLVAGMLGKAYGLALEACGMAETREIREAAAAAAARNKVPEPSVDEEAYEEEASFEEDALDEDGDHDEYVDEDEKSVDGESSEDEESLNAALARSAASSRMQSPHGLLVGRLFDEDELKPPAEEPVDVMGYLPRLRTQNAAFWAEQALRPLTPREEEAKPKGASTIAGKPPSNLMRLDVKRDLWAQPLRAPPAIPELSVGAMVNDDEIVDQRLLDDDAPLALVAEAPIAAPLRRLPGEARTPEDSEADYSTPVASSEVASSEVAEPVAVAAYKAMVAAQSAQSPQSARSPLLPQRARTGRLALREQKQERVDHFSHSLAMATTSFDTRVGAAQPAADERPWSLRSADIDHLIDAASTRGFLKRARIPPKGGKFEEDEAHGTDADVRVFNGAAARVQSPSNGLAPPPPYLAQATPMPTKGTVPAHLKHDCARGKSAERTPHHTPGKPTNRDRPESAGPRARRANKELAPERPDPQILAAAQNVKRFLSRTCGTMKFALQVFDYSGDGRFDRNEWEVGLQKLGYTALCDVQALFTALDKRRHHVLTLSDLLDKYSGMDVFTGVNKPGLMGIASEIIQEVMVECLQEALQEALQNDVQAALLSPSGPQNDLPDLKKWMKRAVSHNKKAHRHQDKPGEVASPGHTREKMATLKKSGSRMSTGGGRLTSPTRGTSSRINTARSTSSKSGDGKDSREPERHFNRKKSSTGRDTGGGSPSRRGQGRHNGAAGSTSRSEERDHKGSASKRGTATSGFGSEAGAGTRSSRSPHRRKKSFVEGRPGSAGSSTSPGTSPGTRSKSGTFARHGSDRRKSKGARHLGGKGWRRCGTDKEPITMRTPNKGLRVPGTVLGASETASSVGEGSPDSNIRFNPKNWRQSGPGPNTFGSTQSNAYTGYRFVDRSSEFPEEPSKHMLRWVPRPVEDVCKSYPHVYRMMASMKQAPQKRSVHVSVPRLGSIGMVDMTSEISGSRPITPGTPSEFDAEAPGALQTVTANSKWRSKSSPHLLTGMTGASTTAGTLPGGCRPGSGSSERSPGDTGCSLPPLVGAANVSARPDLELGSSAAAAIDFESRLAPNEILVG